MPDSKYKIGMLLQGLYCKDNYYLVTKVECSDESRSNKITIKGFTYNSCSDIQEDEEVVDEAYAVLGNFGSDIFAKENVKSDVEDALRASRAMNAADGFELTPTERMFTAMYLTIYSSLKESFDKDLEKAKKDILKETNQELTLNSEVAIANIKKKLKGE